jgi:6-phosphofructokinase 1
VCSRAKDGKNYGTVLIPEGLVMSIPEMAVLINEIDDIFR